MYCRWTRLVAACLVLAVGTSLAEETPLPNPLTMEDALRLADGALPEIELALADRDASDANLAEAESVSRTRLSAYARARAVRPSHVSSDRDNNDSSAMLALRKRLYDFGYSAALEESAQRAGDGSRWRLLDARQQARLDIMRRFFDVIIADLEFAHDNEAMALAFIDADRARDRHELKRLSDVDLLEAEAAYQETLHRRTRSQTRQRVARSQLAIAIGRPDQLPSDVVRPDPPDLEKALPDYDVLLAEALQHSPELQALRAEVEASRAAVRAARNEHGPVLSAELDASVYNRSTSSTHPLGAGLVLEVPLLTGGAKDAAVSAALAVSRRRSAELALAERALRQRLLDLRLRLDDLRVELAGLQVRRDYRELYLDRSRALYELEVKTDLGDAMTEITAVNLARARAEFDWRMAEAEIAALKGLFLPEETTP